MVDCIADTSFVMSLGNRADEHHRACRAVYGRVDAIYLPQTALAEVGYMFGGKIGKRGLANFLKSLPGTKYRILAVEIDDLLRTASCWNNTPIRAWILSMRQLQQWRSG
jgi:hypothetical protein